MVSNDINKDDTNAMTSDAYRMVMEELKAVSVVSPSIDYTEYYKSTLTLFWPKRSPIGWKSEVSNVVLFE